MARYGASRPHARCSRASGRACRAVKAAERDGTAAGARLLRAIRLAWFTSTILLDADEGIAEVAEGVGLDGTAIVAGIPARVVGERPRELDYDLGVRFAPWFV